VTLGAPGPSRGPNQEQGIEACHAGLVPCRHIGRFVLPATAMDMGASMVGEEVTKQFPPEIASNLVDRGEQDQRRPRAPAFCESVWFGT
jgi:hypothetical protein